MWDDVIVDGLVVGPKPCEPRLAAVTPLDDYSLLLEYKTGERKRFDVRPYIQGTFMGKLADVDYFKTARLEYDGWFVGWPGGQDLGPDDLYEFSTPVG